ncbi:MAG TPA: 3'(2'),5'-bisphosphate nucleotidase CysQ [Nitrospina sp.]|jgi:3'(2'), 5'-bisphosphate nucleotidase|nr:3'(2'),5'-bisphosphate nucleotidase CysQ [Nitrospina sp.]|tara:strand:- start:122 stop:895 length:774 start_codon:yes stop_codon:yes gene_type:complete
MIEQIISIAQEAGQTLIGIRRSGDLDVCVKDDSSPVSRADNASDKYIRCALQDQFAIPVITEESTIDYSTRKDWNEFFLVDPLDGTKDYIEMSDDFTINIALIRNQKPVLGVVCVPALGETFFAEGGKGAFVDRKGQRKKLPVTSCSGLVLARSRFHDLENMDQFAIDNKITQYLCVSSAVRFCRLAEGRANLYPGINYSMEWDTAAGHIILTESGGGVTDLETHDEPVYNKPNIMNAPFIAYSREIDFGKLVLPDS